MKLRGLYAITPETGDILASVRDALEGRPALLQYRRAQPETAEAREIVAMCRRAGVPVIVNDDVALALESGADGAHLGRDDGDLAAARRALAGRILGASCYDEPRRAEAALGAGADYIAFGSVFPSPTKPHAVRAPLALFARRYPVPVCAIGGITLANAPSVLAAGADLLAVVTDLFGAPDVRGRALAYGRLFE